MTQTHTYTRTFYAFVHTCTQKRVRTFRLAGAEYKFTISNRKKEHHSRVGVIYDYFLFQILEAKNNNQTGWNKPETLIDRKEAKYLHLSNIFSDISLMCVKCAANVNVLKDRVSLFVLSVKCLEVATSFLVQELNNAPVCRLL